MDSELPTPRILSNSSPDSESSDMQLTQSDPAQPAQQRAADLAIELRRKQCTMAELEWYKECCDNQDVGYYDSFKSQNQKDIDANLRRINLAQFWDDILEMWERHELPSDFKSQNKWVNAGTVYRRLVEPLDIANYYKTHQDSNYLTEGRPNRHKVLERWLEEKDNSRSGRAERPRTRPASLTQDSCFWAYVEEALKDLQYLKQGQHQRLQSLQKFEENVTMMKNSHSLSSDVFLEGSSFTRWCKEWEDYKENQSRGCNCP